MKLLSFVWVLLLCFLGCTNNPNTLSWDDVTYGGPEKSIVLHNNIPFTGVIDDISGVGRYGQYHEYVEVNNGLYHGDYRLWNNWGSQILNEGFVLTEQTTYKDNYVHGRYRTWEVNGKLTYDGLFVDGLPHGLHKSYYPNGDKNEVMEYYLGELISYEVGNGGGEKLNRKKCLDKFPDTWSQKDFGYGPPLKYIGPGKNHEVYDSELDSLLESIWVVNYTKRDTLCYEWYSNRQEKNNINFSVLEFKNNLYYHNDTLYNGNVFFSNYHVKKDYCCDNCTPLDSLIKKDFIVKSGKRISSKESY